MQPATWRSIFRKPRATSTMLREASSTSRFLRDPNLEEVAAFIGNLGRKQPAAVIAGIFLVAVGVSWLLNSAGKMSGRTAVNDRERGAYGVH